MDDMEAQALASLIETIMIADDATTMIADDATTRTVDDAITRIVDEMVAAGGSTDKNEASPEKDLIAEAAIPVDEERKTDILLAGFQHAKSMEATDLTVAAGQVEDPKTYNLLLTAAAVAHDDRHKTLLDEASGFSKDLNNKLAEVNKKIQHLDRYNKLADRAGARKVRVEFSDGSETNVHACLTKLVADVEGIKQRQAAFATKVDTYLGFLNSTIVINESILAELSQLRRDVARLKFELGL